ncbi:hypothetical protein [Hathewaya limosa]|uniref:Seryl-tRNA synthetase n=1 Tax=Hathewaya limosa TaxID=1536 RepID=A0ABU0JUX0_HATLI|nr:hypothetical protein [Hathewaya limosa]AWZ48327.1 hypothetical protein C3495_05620 [Clostridiaceae bacterium 14S0207]MDQ0479712.1 seryl-tRNA synthetase [Hathewaya limosa]
MIYLGDFKKVNEFDFIVNFIHYKPNDHEYGLDEKTLQKGYLIDNLPVEVEKDKISELHFNPVKKECWYVYKEKEQLPKTPVETLQEQNKSLTQQLSRVLISSKKSETMLFKQINTLNIEMNKLKKEGN